LIKVLERNLILNKRNRVNVARCSENNLYTYTLWICYEFFKQLRFKYLTDKIFEDIKSIGSYENGWQKYCSEETNYAVPNVTSAAALVFNECGELDRAKKLVNLLESSQENGNWSYQYFKEEKWEKMKLEDSFHLGLMLYHFYRLKFLIYKKEIVLKSLINFSDKEKWLSSGSIGWSIPITFLIYNLYKNELLTILGEEKLNKRMLILDKEILTSLQHTNFRVRAYSAWCLSKVITNGNC
jgi:hypothetical protein